MEVSERLNRGEQVLALDLLLSGDMTPLKEPERYAMAISTLGQRPLGVRAAQLVAAALWFQGKAKGGVRLECNGIRSQVTGLVGVALAPERFFRSRGTERHAVISTSAGSSGSTPGRR